MAGIKVTLVASRIIALHGFLGRPTDFRALGLANLVAPDIFLTPISGLHHWARRFNSHMNDKPILLGYSMGGRLLLHCLIDNPTLYKAAIIIAAHPGLESVREREDRLAQDYVWAQRFRTDGWQELMAAWNDRGTLKSSEPVIRNERQFTRTALVQALRCFSLGKQEYLIPKINALPIPILWLEENTVNHGQKLVLKHQRSLVVKFSQGGHRFMFTQPNLVATTIGKFLLE